MAKKDKKKTEKPKGPIVHQGPTKTDKRIYMFVGILFVLTILWVVIQ